MAPEPHVQATTYTVNCVPEHILDSDVFAITVEYTGAGRWAVRRGRRCLASRGEWDWEPIPSERAEDWLNYHRFDLETALKLAKQKAPYNVVNGATVDDAMATWTRVEVPS